MSNELDITDARMLELPDLLKKAGKIKYKQEFYDAIEIAKQSIWNIKNGPQHFTAMHIARACAAYGINGNWIVGVEKELYRKDSLVRKVPGSRSGVNKKVNKGS